LPSYEELQPPGYPWFPFWRNLEVRQIERREGDGPGAPRWRAWLRYRPTDTFDDPFVDAGRALLLLDTMGWPAASSAHAHPTPYVAPSMDVAVQFHRAAPANPWLLCDARAPLATEGLIGGYSQVWAADGRLLATGTGQLICRPNPMYPGTP
jgi:acyl-CoA thioesterase